MFVLYFVSRREDVGHVSLVMFLQKILVWGPVSLKILQSYLFIWKLFGKNVCQLDWLTIHNDYRIFTLVCPEPLYYLSSETQNFPNKTNPKMHANVNNSKMKLQPYFPQQPTCYNLPFGAVILNHA